MSECFVVAIDGPAASGKSALGRGLARRLGFAFLDTGLIYRALTALALERGLAPSDAPRLAALARELRFELRPGPGSTRPDQQWVDGRPATAALHTLDVDSNVSAVSAHPEVRAALLPHQRDLAARADTVMVGRDIGTVVLPDANLKLFLVASPEVRAARRWEELIARGGEASYPHILDEMVRRDALDAGRTVAPLRAAPDAVVIHTDQLSLSEELDLAERLVRAASQTGACPPTRGD